MTEYTCPNCFKPLINSSDNCDNCTNTDVTQLPISSSVLNPSDISNDNAKYSGYKPRPNQTKQQPELTTSETIKKVLSDDELSQEAISQAYKLLTPEQKTSYEKLYNKRSKKAFNAYITYFTSAAAGGHKFYLRDNYWGIAYLLGWIPFIIGSLFEKIFILMLIFGLIAYSIALSRFLDIFFLPRHVKSANLKIQKKIILELLGDQNHPSDGFADWWENNPWAWFIAGILSFFLCIAILLLISPSKNQNTTKSDSPIKNNFSKTILNSNFIKQNNKSSKLNDDSSITNKDNSNQNDPSSLVNIIKKDSEQILNNNTSEQDSNTQNNVINNSNNNSSTQDNSNNNLFNSKTNILDTSKK